MLNHIGEAIYATEHEAQYDASAKLLLSDKQILAWILKYTVTEFQGMTIPQIMECIEKPEVSEVPVTPGLSKQAIEGMSQESSIPGEGTVTYDIRFNAAVPEDGQDDVAAAIPQNDGNEKPGATARNNHRYDRRMIINIEAQKDYYPGYDLVTRGILYTARMLSDQIGRNVNLAKSEYNKLQKVYSIWICFSASDREANTISSYRIGHHAVSGNYEDHTRHDLLQVIMIRQPKEKSRRDIADQVNSPNNTRRQGHQPNKLQKLLTVLFSDISAEEKNAKLQEEFNIAVTEQINRGNRKMCNLSQIIKEDALSEGIHIGRMEGINIGRTEAFKEKEKEDVRAAIQEGIPRDTILRMFKISAETYNQCRNLL